MHIKWSKNDDGFFKIWVNGKEKFNYIGQTMTADKIYFKFGLYRSYLKDLRLISKENIPTQKVFYSNVKKAKTREGLLP